MHGPFDADRANVDARRQLEIDLEWAGALVPEAAEILVVQEELGRP
jgi:hypothetical protein